MKFDFDHLSAFAVLFLVSLPGIAQNIYDLDLFELTESSVEFASDFDEDLKDSAVTVTRWDSDTDNNYGFQRIADLADKVPGVFSIPTTFASDGIKIRGFSLGSFRGVALFLDNVPLDNYAFKYGLYNFNDLSLKVLSHAEVIRGPASVQYGTNAFNGVFALKTYEQDKNETQWESQIGSGNHRELAFKHTTLFDNGSRLNIVANKAVTEDADFESQYTDIESQLPQKIHWLTDRDQEFFAVKWQTPNLTEQWNYSLGVYHYSELNKDWLGLGRINSVNATSSSLLQDNDRLGNDSQFNMAKFETVYPTKHFGEWSLQTYLWELDWSYRVGVTEQVDAKNDIQESRLGTKLLWVQDVSKKHHISSALSFDSYKIEKARNQRIHKTLGLIQSSENSLFAGATEKVWAINVQGKYFLKPEWLLNYGVRYDKYNTFGGHVTSRLGLIHHYSRENTFKLLYGHAFRSASASEQRGFPKIQGALDIEPEIIDSVELIHIHQNTNRFIQSILYYNHIKDAIVITDNADQPGISRYQNLSQSDSYGFEFETHLSWSSWLWESGLGISLGQTKQYEQPNSVTTPELSLYSALHFNWNDKHTTTWIQQRTSIEYEEELNDTDNIDTYWRTDLNYRYQHNAVWQFSVNIKNVFDRENFLATTALTENGAPTLGRSIFFDLQVNH